MDPHAELDEADIALLDAVHVAPRVAFEELGRVLDMSAVTAARRWRRLVDDGRAWVSSTPGAAARMPGAFLEVECEPAHARSVAHGLAQLPQAFSVHITTGRMNVYALLVAADRNVLARLLIDVVPAQPGVRSIATASLVQLFSATHWRLGGLTAAQARQFAIPAPVRPSEHTIDDLDRSLYRALQYDGRLNARELARQVDCSASTARRRLELLVRAGLLGFRADFARAEGGWPTYVVLVMTVASAVGVSTVAHALVSWAEVRVCASMVGDTAGLMVTIQLHDLRAVDAIVRRLHDEFPGVAVTSVRSVLCPVKSFGRLLGPDGRAVGVVPVDPWQPIV